MPTTDKQHAISLDEARYRAGSHAFANAGSNRQQQIGLEQELFAIRVDPTGQPVGRLQLAGVDGVIATLDRLAGGRRSPWQRQDSSSGLTEFLLSNGGRITFEPGAQIEHSSVVHPNLVAALDDMRRVKQSLVDLFAPRGVVIAASGIDLWHDIEAAPQQLQAGRYTSMANYYEQRSPWGKVMMRHSASLQINLDHGPEGVWQERWRLANLIAPFVLATFAASPGPQGASVRGRAWQHLDSTRTGFPRLLVEGDDSSSPRDQWAEAALDADVMLYRQADSSDGSDSGDSSYGSTVTGRAGWRFRDWIEHGHPVHGWPTRKDLDYHLTTLFFEVRPRGFLELRSCESLPDQWRPAPVVLITSLLYDDRARSQALALLDSSRQRLPKLWQVAAEVGIRAPELGPMTDRLWGIALAGAARMPRELINAEAIAATHAFLERFTYAGRMPSDELAELMNDPRRTLAWAVGSQAPLPAAVRQASAFSEQRADIANTCSRQ